MAPPALPSLPPSWGDTLEWCRELLSVSVEVFMQKLWMRDVPELGLVGGPAAGLTIVITGPTSGIGREAAMELARRGADVVLACRSLERGEKLRAAIAAEAKERGQPDPTVELMELDLNSLASVRRFAAAWTERGRPLHVLLCNAGLFALGARQRSSTADGLESHLGTNYLAHYLLAILLLPSLRAAAGKTGRPARVVSVASKLHYLGRIHTEDPQLERPGAFNALAAYAQSKLAQVLFSPELQRRGGNAVRAVALHPGEVMAAMVMTDVVRSLPGAMQRAYRLLLQAILLTPAQGARCSVYCSTSEDLDKAASKAHTYYDSNCRPVTPSPTAQDEQVAAWLWDWSAAAVGLTLEERRAAGLEE